MAREKLDAVVVAQRMAEVPDWRIGEDGSSITRTFTFRNFNEAFGFMARCALAAERMDHHPDWSNVYKTVSVTLSTHDAGGLTALDFDLAKKMDRYAL